MFLQEAYNILETTTSMIRRNRMVKRNAYAGRATVNLAKKNNPALYNRYKLERLRYMKLKKMMNQRYKNKARMIARKTIR